MSKGIIGAITDLTKAITRLAKDLEQQGRCSHEIEEIKYFYDDDWGHRGSIAWDSHWNEKEFCYCKKCGQVFLRDRVERK